MNDKEIFYQILERYIDNIVQGGGPLVSLLSQPIKNWVFNFVDPYVNAFFIADTKELNVKAAANFLKSEVSEKIENFLRDFEASKEEK